MPSLEIIKGPGVGRIIAPSTTGAVIGRQSGLEVSLDSGAISRRHARITWEGVAVFVEDLGSSNGTFINEKRISGRTRLGSGDTLRVGPTSIRLEGVTHGDAEMTIQTQTVSATSNTELFQHNAGTKFQAVLELVHHLGRSLDTDLVMDRLLEQLLVLFPNADRALVILREGDEPSIRAIKNRGSMPAAGPVFSRSVLRKVFTQGVAVLAEDASKAQSLLTNVTLDAMGTQSLLCVPLQTHGGRVFGALQLDRFLSGRPFTQDDLYLLTAVALMVSTVLENAELHEEMLDKERMQRDLAMAREIQLGYLPRELVQMAGGPVDLVADLEPALEVSGDFYDYFPLDDRRLAFAVADVSGKGMPAALFMTMVHALARHLAQNVRGPAELLSLLNEAIVRDNPSFMFVTMVFGIYDTATGRVTLAHAGHPPSLLRRKDGTVEELLHRGAPLLGINPEIRLAEEADIQLLPGDAVLLYTDGVTESPGATNAGELFGAARLMESVQRCAGDGPLSHWAATIRDAVSQFSGGSSMADDITLLALRRPS